MVTVTEQNVQALEQSVSRVSARSEPDPQPQGSGWTQYLASQIREHRERWQGMTAAEQREILETETAIAEFHQRRDTLAEHKTRLKKREAVLKRSGCRLTDEAWEAVIADQVVSTTALVALEQWAAAGARPWIVLSGTTGCGKSFAAAEAIAHRGGEWVRADELVRIWWANFGDQYERQDTVRNARLLVIDDLGCELDAQRQLSVLLDLLDARKSARKHPTIVTTNLTKHAFAARYDNERLMSRMHESVQWVALDAGDMRRTGPR